MVRLRSAVLGALAVLGLSAPLAPHAAVGQEAPGGDAAAELEAKRHAPVICVWQLYMATRVMGEKCHAGEDKALMDTLDVSIGRMDEFIMKNGPATRDQVDNFKKQFHDQSASQDICANPGATAMYGDAKQAGVERIRKDTDQLLEIPRQPTKEGC
jgi:hypothetical protein